MARLQCQNPEQYQNHTLRIQVHGIKSMRLFTNNNTNSKRHQHLYRFTRCVWHLTVRKYLVKGKWEDWRLLASSRYPSSFSIIRYRYQLLGKKLYTCKLFFVDTVFNITSSSPSLLFSNNRPHATALFRRKKKKPKPTNASTFTGAASRSGCQDFLPETNSPNRDLW